MSAINLQKFRVPEKEYLGHVTNTLSQIPADRKAILFFLCKKLAKFSDDEERNVLIAYEAGNTDANDLVLSWATVIATEHLLLPPLMMNYMVASMEEERFMELCKTPEEQIEDDDLRLAIIRYKDETKKEAQHQA